MKTINTIFMLLALSTFHAFGQDYRIKKQFFIGLFASADISVLGGKNDVSRFGYTIGGEALYQINSRIAISMGLLYSLKSEGTKTNQNLVYQTSSSIEPTKIKFIYNTSYLEVPIRIDFYLSRKKIAPFITTGISTNIFLGEQTKTIAGYQDGREETFTGNGQSGLSTVDPQFQFGLGMDAAFRKTRLRAFPIVRISILKNRFTSLGFGINYFFSVKHS